MDWFLVILAIVGFILTVGVALYLVALYCSEDDKNQAWFPKIVVVVGLSLSTFSVLLLPFDVANKRDPTEMGATTGGLNVEVMWMIVLSMIAVWLLIVTPFTTFYYESWDPTQTNIWNQIRPALCYTVAFLVFFILLFVILWLTMGKADLAFEGLSSPASNWNLLSEDILWSSKVPFVSTTCFCDKAYNFCTTSNFGKGTQCLAADGTLSIGVSAFIYIVALICALGWFTFVVFGGAGIIALPMDLINEWRTRPKKISKLEFAKMKADIAAEVEQLIRDGKDLQDHEDSGKKSFFGGQKKKVNKFGEKVAELEDRWEKVDNYKNRSVVMEYLKLPLGILGLVLSFLWVLHIILNNLADVTPFLNNMFVGLDSFFPLFGTLAYTVFAMWMLWAAVKGCFKIGCNFGIIRIHPMKVNDTLMSSFLFNTLLVLITSVTVAQFCALSFRKYASNTVVDSLFSTYVSNLRGIGYIMRYFQIVFLIFSGLTFLYLVVKPCLCGGGRKPAI